MIQIRSVSSVGSRICSSDSADRGSKNSLLSDDICALACLYNRVVIGIHALDILYGPDIWGRYFHSDSRPFSSRVLQRSDPHMDCHVETDLPCARQRVCLSPASSVPASLAIGQQMAVLERDTGVLLLLLNVGLLCLSRLPPL